MYFTAEGHSPGVSFRGDGTRHDSALVARKKFSGNSSSDSDAEARLMLSSYYIM